eukprot:scaffold132069_cov28-Tisochrysis_lutea.AAC.1
MPSTLGTDRLRQPHDIYSRFTVPMRARVELSCSSQPSAEWSRAWSNARVTSRTWSNARFSARCKGGREAWWACGQFVGSTRLMVPDLSGDSWICRARECDDSTSL